MPTHCDEGLVNLSMPGIKQALASTGTAVVFCQGLEFTILEKWSSPGEKWLPKIPLSLFVYCYVIYCTVMNGEKDTKLHKQGILLN